MNDDLNKQFRATVDRYLDEIIADFYKTVPYSTHQRDDGTINLDYYKRHNVETILRLRMKRTIDALTIHYFTKTNPRLAKVWASYTEDEMLHDSMFLADLERVGMHADQVYGTEPFMATKLLQGYFYYGIEHEGRPLASLCSSYFIEYTTERTQPQWIENISKVLGAEKVRGQLAHVTHDQDDHHIDFVWVVIESFLKSDADREAVFRHISNVYDLFKMYFKELHEQVILGKTPDYTKLTAAAE